ncbi:MAG: tetratricopeptide repeat protein [Cyanobacteria bacterium REEB67]|nr:tetratricopeptide repeat protein [Cyanobacteria bacterium REEB67]
MTNFKNTKASPDCLRKLRTKLRLTTLLSGLSILQIALTDPAQAGPEYQRHYDLGKDFLQRQEYKLAMQELTLAAGKPATPVEVAAALVDRGTAHSELKEYTAALADFDRAITLDSKSHLAYNNRGVVFFRQGQPEKAIPDFDKALALDINDKYAVVNRAGAYLMTDRAATLAVNTENWLKQKKWHSDFAAQAAVLTALAYLAGGDKTRATAITQAAVKNLDKLIWPYQMLSYLNGKLEPEKVVEASQESTYELTQAECYMGLDYYIQGKSSFDKAKDKLSFVVKHGTTNSVEYWVGKYYLAKLEPRKTSLPIKTAH